MWESDGEDGRGLPQAKPWDPQFGGLPIGSISELQGSSALKGQAQPENLLLIPSPTLPGAQVASAREKNRLTQRRFRQKGKERMKEMEAQAQSLGQQLARMREENERLGLEQTLLEKTLAVRNAMLELAVQLDTQRPGAAAAAAAPQAASASGWGSAGQDGGPGWVPALFQGEAPVATACLQLATALGQLASLEQVEEMVAQLPPSSSGDSSAASPFAMPATSGQHQDGSGDSGRAGPKGLLAAANLPAAGGSGGVGLDLQLSGAVTLGAPADDLAASAEALLEPPGSGGSGSVLAGMIAAAERIDLEGNKLQQLPVPPPDNPSICQKVQDMDTLDALVGYWRRWRERTVQVYREAADGGFADQAVLRTMEAHLHEMVEVFWHAAHLKPRFFNAFFLTTLPPPGIDMSAEWGRVAAESLGMLSEAEVTHIRRAWSRYCKRAAMAAVGVQPWLQRLQAVVAPGLADAPQRAQQHLEAAHVASRLHAACQEQYLASMAFLAETGPGLNAPVRCLWQISGGHYCPDHPAIISAVLQQYQERRQQQQQQQTATTAPPGQ